MGPGIRARWIRLLPARWIASRPQNAWVDSGKSARGILHVGNRPISVPPPFGLGDGAALPWPMPNFVLLDTKRPDLARRPQHGCILGRSANRTTFSLDGRRRRSDS